jgi:hypothetical protein
MSKEEILRSTIREELSNKIPAELIDSVLISYERVLTEFRKGRWEETLWSAGKFAENTFRILVFLSEGKVERECPNFAEVRAVLEKSPSEKLPESVRLLIPRVASSFVYDLRSKRAVVHVKEIEPYYMDANLVLYACSWILAEFVRLYHTSDTQKVMEILNELIQRKVPFIEMHEGKTFVTKPIDCQSEILLLLLNSPKGANRKEIGSVLGRNYTQGRITQSLQELEAARQILKPKENYIISGPGEERINKVLSKFS